VNGKILLGVVFLAEAAGGGIELLGIRLFVYGDFPDRSEALFLRSPVMVSHGPRLWFFCQNRTPGNWHGASRYKSRLVRLDYL
jgi:hypothetical protein